MPQYAGVGLVVHHLHQGMVKAVTGGRIKDYRRAPRRSSRRGSGWIDENGGALQTPAEPAAHTAGEERNQEQYDGNEEHDLSRVATLLASTSGWSMTRISLRSIRATLLRCLVADTEYVAGR